MLNAGLTSPGPFRPLLSVAASLFLPSLSLSLCLSLTPLPPRPLRTKRQSQILTGFLIILFFFFLLPPHSIPIFPSLRPGLFFLLFFLSFNTSLSLEKDSPAPCHGNADGDYYLV
ncbi:hypothetical protein LX36DRAFT_199494 [Colletotrichum falcatum]|nr:hypothetical protein LX36DRAFT_199494 [Colletotrichum falcatum]